MTQNCYNKMELKVTGMPPCRLVEDCITTHCTTKFCSLSTDSFYSVSLTEDILYLIMMSKQKSLSVPEKVELKMWLKGCIKKNVVKFGVLPSAVSTIINLGVPYENL